MNEWLNGKALMHEIDQSVLSWCSDHAPADAVFHGALLDEWDPTDEELALAAENFFEVEGRPPQRISEIVFRKPTWEHIPDHMGRLAAPAKGLPATGLPFQPFEHYRYRRHRPVCVLRSHWVGTVNEGRFRGPDEPQGRMTDTLGEMIMMLVEQFAKRKNWRFYTNLKEMKADARLALVGGMLKFSPLKSSNPFAYATRTMNTSFIITRREREERRGHERYIGSKDIGDDGEGFDAIDCETAAEAAEREFDTALREAGY